MMALANAPGLPQVEEKLRRHFVEMESGTRFGAC
jgi:hypothetical protein